MSGKITDNLGRSSGLIKEASGGGGGTSISDADANTKIQVEESSDENIIRMDTAGTEVVKIDADGIMTKPLQPCFHAYVGTTQNNIATGSDLTINYDTEVWDLNSDFDTSNKTFTAPVTGKYMFNCQYRVEFLDNGANFYNLKLVTSNCTYRALNDIKSWGINDPDFFAFNLNVIADMDASDTAVLKFFQSGGTAQVDGAANDRTNQDGWFCAYLLT